MSAVERDRAHVIRQTQEKQLRQREAAERLGIGVRQFKRLVRSWKQQGDAGLVSRQRGRASNNRLVAEQRCRIAALLSDKYGDFGPTLATEKLAEREGIAVSVETVRQIQIGLGLWRAKTRRVKRVFQLRERRPRFGELIQIDGSPHAWLEDRGPRCTLIVFIDDATNRLTALHFLPRRRRGRIWKRCAAMCWSTAVRWRFTRIGTASSGSTRRTRRAAMARQSSGVWRSG